MASGLCNINPSQGAVTFIVLKCAPSRSPQEMYKGPMWHLHSHCVRLDSVIFPDHSSEDCTEQVPVRLPNTQCIANKQKQRGPVPTRAPYQRIAYYGQSSSSILSNWRFWKQAETQSCDICPVPQAKYQATNILQPAHPWSTEHPLNVDWYITEWSPYSKRAYNYEFYSFDIKNTRPCLSVFELFCFYVIKRIVHIGVGEGSWRQVSITGLETVRICVCGRGRELGICLHTLESYQHSNN